MRHSIILIFLSLLSSTAFGQKSARASDSTAILTATEALVTSWNNHNYADMATYATPDVDWVNIVGMWWKGRDAVQKAHQVYHQSMFKNTPLTTVNTTVRFITPDVALVHHLTSIGTFTTPGGHTAGNDQNLATLVFVKQQGKWLLTAGQNVPVDAQAARHDPVNTSR